MPSLHTRPAIHTGRLMRKRTTEVNTRAVCWYCWHPIPDAWTLDADTRGDLLETRVSTTPQGMTCWLLFDTKVCPKSC